MVKPQIGALLCIAFLANGIAAQQATIFSTIQSRPELSSLLAAVRTAGLTDRLSDATLRWTVLAPNNAAFAAAKLGGLTNAQLANVLNFNFIPGQVLQANQIGAGRTFTTVQGGTITSAIADDVVIFRGGRALNSQLLTEANIITPNIAAGNSILQITDGVLVPEGTFPPAAAPPVASSTPVQTTARTPPAVTPAPTGGADIFSALQSQPQLTSMVAAVQKAGLQSRLQDATLRWTVLAPNNAAFQAANLGTLSATQLANTLNFNFIPGQVLQANQIGAGRTFKTVQGGNITSAIADDVVRFRGGRAPGSSLLSEANIITPNIPAGNSIIHITDGVLIPEAAAQTGRKLLMSI